MPWKYKSREIAVGNSWTDDDGVKHPDNWIIWSDADKKKMGISFESEPEPYDDRFYVGRDTDGKLVEKGLDDYVEKDLETGKDMVDADGNKVQVTRLKKIWIEKTKNTARGLLKNSDWYVVRKADTGEAIPSDTATYRAKIRTECKAIEDKITACSDLAAFIKLFDSDGSGVADIHNWSTE